MEIKIDSRATYEAIKRDREKFVREVKYDLGLDSGDIAVTQKIAARTRTLIGEVRLALPFGALTASFRTDDEVYKASIVLSPPAKVDVDPYARAERSKRQKKYAERRAVETSRRVEDCFRGLRRRLRRTYGPQYHPMGKEMDGFLLDGRGDSRLAIVRCPQGFLELKIGEGGVCEKRFDDLEGFAADMSLLESDLNRIVNMGLNEAVKNDLLESNPTTRIRLAPFYVEPVKEPGEE